MTLTGLGISMPTVSNLLKRHAALAVMRASQATSNRVNSLTGPETTAHTREHAGAEASHSIRNRALSPRLTVVAPRPRTVGRASLTNCSGRASRMKRTLRRGIGGLSSHDQCWRAACLDPSIGRLSFVFRNGLSMNRQDRIAATNVSGTPIMPSGTGSTTPRRNRRIMYIG